MSLVVVTKWFHELILNPKPPEWWIKTRFILNWLTIPLKLLLIGGLGGFQIIKAKLFSKKRNPEIVTNTINIDTIYRKLPIFQGQHLAFYANRVPISQEITGFNHNDDHQLSRSGTLAFLLSVSGLPRPPQLDSGLSAHIQNGHLCRGYTINDGIKLNVATTSGDMLCGLNLAMLNSNDSDVLQMKYDILVKNIIQNDYSILEGKMPSIEEPILREIYENRLKAVNGVEEWVKMKSARGMWQPSIENVGAQALTLLSTLKVAQVKLGNQLAGAEYEKLMWKHGLAFLSLFPTAYIKSRRGYFNDHNCMISLYVLSKLSKNKWEKRFWKFAMTYVWNLSKHWYNGYFTGLYFDAYPELLEKPENKQYIQDCFSYLLEVNVEEILKRPMVFTRSKHQNEVPVKISNIGEDEFYPDIAHDIIATEWIDNPDYYRTGLGYFASAVMLSSALKKANLITKQ